MGIIHWGMRMGRTLETNPFREFYFQLFPSIHHSAIGKTILVRSLIVRIFTHVENQPLKQRLKQKRRIILTNLQNIFSFAEL